MVIFKMFQNQIFMANSCTKNMSVLFAMENQYFSSLFTSRIEVPRINKTYFCPLMSFRRREYRNQLQKSLQGLSRTVIFEISSTSGPKSCPQKKKVLYRLMESYEKKFGNATFRRKNAFGAINFATL